MAGSRRRYLGDLFRALVHAGICLFWIAVGVSVILALAQR